MRCSTFPHKSRCIVEEKGACSAHSLFLKYPNPMAFQNGDTQVSLPSPFHYSHSNPFLLLLLPSAFPACSIYRSSCLLGKLDKCGNGSTPLSLLRRSLFWPAFEVQLQSASFPSRSLISNVRARPAPRRLRRQNNNFCRKVSSWRARRAIAPPSINRARRCRSWRKEILSGAAAGKKCAL